MLIPAVVLGLLAAGAAAQAGAEARDRRRHPAPGRVVRAGDVDVHVLVEGSGPAVLVDSGLGGSSLEWAAVAAGLASEAQVIRYDRPGFAWSPGSRADRRALAAAGRIVALLDALDVSTPAVLVGHSLGGVHVRLAAALAPERVRGLVLVDPSHEGMLDVVETSRAGAVVRGVLRGASWLAPLGAGRVVGRGFSRLALAEARQPLSPQQQAAVRLSGLLTSRTGHGLRALSAEHDALAASLRQLAEVVEPDLPVVVITAGAPGRNAREVQARAEVDAMHAGLVAGRPGARHVVAERSGHLVPLDDPEVVVRCVREVLAAHSRSDERGERA